MTRPTIVAAVVAASSLAAGCHDQPTQVVLVVDSDLVAPSEVNTFSVSVAPGPFEPPPEVFIAGAQIGAFPISLGIVSQGGTPSFSLVVRLLDNDQNGQPLIVVSKTVTDVRFVAEQTQMLLLDLPRSCACEGTSCPLPGNPVCDKATNPALVPFDPARAPSIDTAPRFAANRTPQ
jgi:hypothetical protein